MQFRFKDGENTYPLDAPGWCVQSGFVPPSSRYDPLIASGVPSYVYPGGELIEELARDVTFSLPLVHTGGNSQQSRRSLESFIRRGLNNRTLELQVRFDHAFDDEPLWGQWGAWETFEIIHASSLQVDSRVGIGDKRGWSFAELGVTSRPATLGQPQRAAMARGGVTDAVGADGLSRGVSVAVAGTPTQLLTVPSIAWSNTAFSLTFVWERGATTGATARQLFVASEFANGFGVYYDALTSKWFLSDSDATIESGEADFPAVGASAMITVTGADGGNLRLYVDGQKVAEITAAAIDLDDLVIGTDIGGTSGIGGVFRLMSTYDTAMTPAQVAADYADLTSVMASGVSPSPIPYLWTPNGDGVFDNARDDTGSTDAPHYNYGWVAGVGGSVPAKTAIDFYMSVATNNILQAAISLAPFGERFDPLGVLYIEAASSATAEVTSSGGSHLTATIDAGWSGVFPNSPDPGLLDGRSVAAYVRLQSGSTGNFEIKLSAASSGAEAETPALKVADSTAFRLIRTPFLTMPTAPLASELLGDQTSTVSPFVRRSSLAGAALLDYSLIMPRPLTETYFPVFSSVRAGVVLNEDSAALYTNPDSATNWFVIARRGDILRAHPHKQNLLMAVMGNNAVNPLIAWYADVTVTVTPQWSVQ